MALSGRKTSPPMGCQASASEVLTWLCARLGASQADGSPIHPKADTQRLRNCEMAGFGAQDRSVSVRYRPKADIRLQSTDR